MLSLSSRIITVHCLKVSFPMKSTAWLQKENSLRILMMTLHYRIMPRQHDPQRRILMMTTHRSYDSHLPMTSFVRKRAEGEAGDDDDDSDQSVRGFGGEVATSSGVMSAHS